MGLVHVGVECLHAHAAAPAREPALGPAVEREARDDLARGGVGVKVRFRVRFRVRVRGRVRVRIG